MTGLGGRLVALLKRIRRQTIWEPGAIPAHEGELAADLKRYVLPAVDAALIVMGLVAINSGMPSFDLLYNELVSTVCAWALTIGACAAALGVSFPKLWLLEALGKLTVFAISVGYSAALLVLYFRGEPSRGFVAGALAVVAIISLWNLIRLGREHHRRQLAAKIERARRAAEARREK